MAASDKTIAEGLHRMLSDAPQDEHPRIIRVFAAFLGKRRLLHRAAGIQRAFAAYAEICDDTQLRIEAAHAITLPDALVEIRPELIAGARARKGDRIADASVRGRLRELHRALRA